MQAIRLIVNADDFGFTRDVNDGILASHCDGILTATTLMATGFAFRHAVELAKQHPALDIGCHLVLVQGPGLPETMPALLLALARRQLDPYGEFRRQIEIILKAGLRPTHLDTHKHTHVLYPIRQAVLRLSEEYGIPWIRRPADFGLDLSAPIAVRAKSIAMQAALRGFDSELAHVNGRRTDHFTGFQLTGRLLPGTLIATLQTLPTGTTELMCHPGFLGADLAAARTRLKLSRVEEWRTLCAEQVRAVIRQRNIQLVTYRDL